MGGHIYHDKQEFGIITDLLLLQNLSRPLWPQNFINTKFVLNFRNALPSTTPKQFSEFSNSLEKLVIYHDMCAISQSLHLNPSGIGKFQKYLPLQEWTRKTDFYGYM